MIPLAVPNLSGNEKTYLIECVEKNFVSTAGAFVGEFEKHVAHWSGTEDALAVNTGTSALHLSLIGANVVSDTLVICPNFSFIASVNAISYCGASPWFVDIEKETWTLDPKKLNEALSTKTYNQNGKVKHKDSHQTVSAIMVVYTLGLPAKMDELRVIANEFGLPLIADAAAAIGASYKQQKIGKLADFTSYSFNGNKIITSGGGGAIVSSSSEKLKFLRHISTTARSGKDYDHDEIGYNYRMTNIQAAVGCAQFEKLNYYLDCKKKIRTFYDEEFKDVRDISSFPSVSYASGANWFSGVVLEGKLASYADQIIAEMNLVQIDVRPFWKPLCDQPKFLKAPREDVHFSKNLWNRIICLPCSTSITDDQLKKVSTELKRIINQIKG